MKTKISIITVLVITLFGVFYAVFKNGKSLSGNENTNSTRNISSSGGNLNKINSSERNHGQYREQSDYDKKKLSKNSIISKLTQEVVEKYHSNPALLTEILESEKYSNNVLLIGRILIEDDLIDSYELLNSFSSLKDSSSAYGLCSDLAAKISKTDIAKAFSFADKLSPGIIRESVISATSENMLPKDWLAAISYANKSGLNEDKQIINSAIQKRVGEASDDQLSILLKSKNLPQELTDSLAREYGKRIFNENDVEASLSLINKMPTSARSAIKHGIFSAAVTSKKQEEWLIDYLNKDTTWDNFTKAQYTITMARNKMNSSNPKDVMEWSLSLANQDLAEGTAQGAFQSWMQRDSMKASAWAATLPSGSGKDAVVTTLIANLVQLGDHVNASKWLPQITSPAAQSNAKRILSRRY